MSYRDPLIKEMKKNVYHLTISQPITDHHPNLQPFFEQLETFFRRGLRRSASMFEQGLKDYWSCFEAFNLYLLQTKKRHPIFMEEAFESVKQSKKVLTEQGRGRCFLRYALQRRFLDDLVMMLSAHPKFLHAWYYGDTALLYDNIQVEIFSSVLKQLNELKFELNLNNQSFLDQTFAMPVYRKVTLVPCNRLGIEILHTKTHCVVSAIEKGSVIEENREVEVGDVLDELFQVALRRCRIGMISSLLKKMKEKPIEMTLLKSISADGTPFRPIKLLSNEMMSTPPFKSGSNHFKVGRTPPHALLPEQCDDEIPVHNNEDKAVYHAKYLGCVYVGQNGSVGRIEESIGVMQDYMRKVPVDTSTDKQLNTIKNGTSNNNKSVNNIDDNNNDNNDDDNNNEEFVEFVHKDNLIYKVHARTDLVQLRLGETDLSVFKRDDLLLKASYTEISACGRFDDNSLIFACIIGETTCTIATQFLAHVFKARSPAEAKVLLCTIAQGFERTHWFV